MSFFKSLFGVPGTLNQSNRELGHLAESAIPEGEAATERAGKFYGDIVSGNRQRQAEAIAPEVNRATAGATAQRNRLSTEGTSRGGGSTPFLLAAEAAPTATAVDTLTALQPAAAAGEAGVGHTLLGAGEGAASKLGSQALTQYGQQLQAVFDTLALLKPGGSGSEPIPSPPPEELNPGGGFQPTDINPPPTGEEGVLGVPPEGY